MARARHVQRGAAQERRPSPCTAGTRGPPTANGRPGIHHVLARTFKDIFPRFKHMQGYHCPRKAGWDTHGLPVEHEIEKELGIFDKAEIERQVGVAEFTRRCRESVMRYIGDWERMTERMGFWVNMGDAYYTLDNSFIESVWWLLRRIWDKGLIYQGYKVVPYDPRIGATLSSHEVALGYKEVEDPSIYVRFPVDGRGANFVPGVDHHAMDAAFESRPRGAPRGRLRPRAHRFRPRREYSKRGAGRCELAWRRDRDPRRGPRRRGVAGRRTHHREEK